MAERPDDQPFLERWSRRKQTRPEAEDGRTAAKPADQTSSPARDAAAPVKGPDAESQAAREAEIVARLPDIDSLDESSDFTVFLQQGVPEALRRQALRKLWRLNPIFAHLDGLNEYDEDFTAARTGVAGLKTAYKVGKGYLSDDEPAVSSGEQPGPSAAESVTSEEVAGAQERVDEGAPADAEEPPEAASAAGEPEPTPAAAESSTAPDPRRGGARAAERRWGRRDT